jgi:rod shape-determining protein MreC
MRYLFRFLSNNYFLFLFIFFEIICMYLVSNNNRYYNSSFVNTSNEVTSSIYQSENNILKFFSLGRVNDSLIIENVKLQQLLSRNYVSNAVTIDSLQDTSDAELEQVYSLMHAQVINNTTDKSKNFIYLDKGSKDGIAKNMGVYNDKGIVGITIGVSKNYSVVMSVLNTDSRVGVKLTKDNYFGNLTWDTKSSKYATLSQIPNHVKVAKHDTVMTSGYSSFFPAGIMVGTVESWQEITGSNLLELKIKLSTDFHNLNYLYIVNHMRKNELKALEKLVDEPAEH